MSRTPKWLYLKEWLSYADVVKLLENSPTCLEYALAQDCSEEIRNNYRFVCTFSPGICEMECKEYRFEEIARQKMRTHLKEHINALKSEQGHDFKIRNQLFKGNKTAQKHKSPVAANNKDVPAKKAKSAKKTKGKSAKSKFTKLKIVAIDEVPPIKLEEPELKIELDEHQVSSNLDYKPEGATNFYSNEDDCKLKEENLCDEDDEESDTRNYETQTMQVGKEQETFQYKVATKLFATHRLQWDNIEKVLDDIVSSESPAECLSLEDRDKILVGMTQWMDSVQIYDHQTVSRLQDPLTAAEKTLLESLTAEDWRKLDASHDSESKLRLTVYARMLLRDYECFPRKLKPKYCQHCGKNYTASTSLYSHLVSLSGIRFWVCSKCKDSNMEDATFTRKHSLQYHILKEVGIPRYRCTQPGCNKTHNHTHHQRSHVMQHTGEKHYICRIDECNGRFSNRNTYSRHLLQFHSVELTRSNQLQEIDEKEARLKVYAARLKARERSKCKRQQGTSTVTTQSPTDVMPRKGTIDENILTAAQHFLTEVKLEEDKKKDGKEKETQANLEKFMRPSASKLLYGIAKDVRNTTTSIEEAKPENNMGGLNLLATVSKYMNFETCARDGEENCEKQETMPCSISAMNSTDNENLKNELKEKENNSNVFNTFNCSASDVCEKMEMSSVTNVKEEASKSNEKVSTVVSHNQIINCDHDRNGNRILNIISESQERKTSDSMTITRVKVVSLPSSCHTAQSINSSSKLMTTTQAPLLQVESRHGSYELKGNVSLLPYQTSTIAPATSPSAREGMIESSQQNMKVSQSVDNIGGSKTISPSLVPMKFNPLISIKNINQFKTMVGIKSNSDPSKAPNQNQEFRLSCSIVPETKVASASRSYTGQIEEKQRENAEPPTSSYISSQSVDKCTQVLNVSRSETPLQLKSMTTLSGKTYIVLSSSGKQYKIQTQQSVPGNSSVSNETLTSSRVLPFSEL